MAPHTISKISGDDPSPATIYKITEVPEITSLPKPAKGREDTRQNLHYSYGPTTVTGYVDAITYATVAEIQVLGIKLGRFDGSIKEGLEVKVDIAAASGMIKFLIKNGSEAWISQRIAVKFGEHFDREDKLFDIQTHGESILLGQGKQPIKARL